MNQDHRRAPGLSARADKALRRTAVAAVFVIAAAAAVLSFNGLRNLALAADIPVELAWIFPIVVDGLTLVGSLGVVHAVLTGMRSWYPWLLTLLGVGLSVWGNVASSPPTLVAQIVHAIPPIVLALSLEALLKVYRYRAVAGYLEENAATEQEREAIREAAERLPLPGEDPVFGLTGLHPDAGTPPKAPTKTVESAVRADQRQTGSDADPAPARALPGGTMREQLTAMLAANPDLTAAEAARTLGKDRSNVAKVLRDIKAAAVSAS